MGNTAESHAETFPRRRTTPAARIGDVSAETP
jgi:hypothetical protein